MRKHLYLALIAAIFCSCTVSQKRKEKRDLSKSSYLLKNKDRLRDAVAFSLEFSLENSIKEFDVDEIADRKMRKLVSDFGSNVDIHYNTDDDVYDSTVTFKVLNLSGVHEVIYCFAANPLERKTYSNQSNALVKVTENIYYVRRPFPMM
jgi:hypothetical protein